MKNELLSNAAGAGGVETARSRWMVVDDNKEVLNTITFLLQRSTSQPIHPFESSVQALNSFRASPESWGLVLTDLEMPGIDGIRLCRQVRTLSPGIRVFLATGSGIITTEEARRLGFTGLIHKPFSFSALLQMLMAAEATTTRPATAARELAGQIAA